MEEKYIYILSALSVRIKTEDDLKKEYEKTKITHDSWKDKPFEKYVQFVKSWHQDEYSVSSYDAAYFEDYETAKEYAINNVMDINEAGAYNYIMIRRVPLNMMYADAEMSDFHLFRYVYDSSKYAEETWCEKEEYQQSDVAKKQKAIMQEMNGMISNWDKAVPSVDGWRFLTESGE